MGRTYRPDLTVDCEVKGEIKKCIFEFKFGEAWLRGEKLGRKFSNIKTQASIMVILWL
jgi:hypothetical protein